MDTLLKIATILFSWIPRPESRYKRFFRKAPGCFVIVDTRKGVFVEVNEEFASKLGYTASELKGKRFMGMIHPEDVHKTNEARENAASGAPVRGFQNRYRTKSGIYVDVMWYSSANGLVYAIAYVE